MQPFRILRTSSLPETASLPVLHHIFMTANDKKFISEQQTADIAQRMNALQRQEFSKGIPFVEFKDYLSEQLVALIEQEENTLQALDVISGLSEKGSLSFVSDVDNTLHDGFPQGQHRNFDRHEHLSLTLQALSRTYNGAFAFLTGRPDVFLKHAFNDVSGIHASEFGAIVVKRTATGTTETIKSAINIDYSDLDAKFNQTMSDHPEIFARCFIEEDKVSSLTVALNAAGDKQELALSILGEIAQNFVRDHNRQHPDKPLQVKPNPARYNCTLEICLVNGGNKRVCLNDIMDIPPFQGTIPIAFGDSGPDAGMLDEATERGGFSISVGPQLPSLGHRAGCNVPTPMSVRRLLESLVFSKQKDIPIQISKTCRREALKAIARKL